MRAQVCVIPCAWIGHLKGLTARAISLEVNPSAGGTLHGRLATASACTVRARYMGLKWLGHYYIKRASVLCNILMVQMNLKC